MRRLLSIALLAVFGLPFAAAFLSGTAAADQRLPACCRRTGAHHCAGGMGGERALGADASSSKDPHWRALFARCPYSPDGVVSAGGMNLGAPEAAHSIALLAAHPAGVPQTECRRRIARDRARGTRGPPASLSA